MNLSRISFYMKVRVNLIFFLLSIISLILIFSNILIEATGTNYYHIFFNLALILSTVYVITLLPTYPIFFIFLKEKDFNFLEKLSFTIIGNLIFYIFLGYCGHLFKLPITGIFFFYGVFFSYLSIIFYMLYHKHRKGLKLFLSSANYSNGIERNFKELSLLNYLKKSISLNSVLLVLFLIFICLLYAVKFSYFYGTDAMLHIFIIKKIAFINYLPVEEYYGSVGLHIIGAVINFFSGVDIIIIPKYFVFYTYFVSGLIFYNLLKRIFKNKNLALFGVFFLEFFAVGFDHLMYQFWPTSLTTIQCLMIFFILYHRLQGLIRLETPLKDDLLNDTIFSYVFIVVIFIGAILTHALIALLFLGSFLFTYFIYFLKGIKRGIDFSLLLLLVGIYLLFYSFGLSSSFFFSINIFTIPWYFYLIGGVIGIYIILRLRKSVWFTPGRFHLEINGTKHQYYKIIENKVILPLSFLLIPFFIVIFFISNALLLDINISNSLLGLETFIIFIYGYWGLLLFQKKPKGKVIILWGYAFGILFAVGFFIDNYSGVFMSGRIIILASPIIIIGFIAYVYKLINLKKIGTSKVKFFLISLVVFSFFASFYDQLTDLDDLNYSFQRREVYSATWLSEHTNDKNVIITEFGGNKIFFYFDYPFHENNEMLRGEDIHYFMLNVENFFPPDTHINDITGENILQALKEQYGTNVYIILDDVFELMNSWEVFGRLSKDEMDEYYNLPYLNKISSTKSESGIIVPYYWVI